MKKAISYILALSMAASCLANTAVFAQNEPPVLFADAAEGSADTVNQQTYVINIGDVTFNRVQLVWDKEVNNEEVTVTIKDDDYTVKANGYSANVLASDLEDDEEFSLINYNEKGADGNTTTETKVNKIYVTSSARPIVRLYKDDKIDLTYAGHENLGNDDNARKAFDKNFTADKGRLAFDPVPYNTTPGKSSVSATLNDVYSISEFVLYTHGNSGWYPKEYNINIGNSSTNVVPPEGKKSSEDNQQNHNKIYDGFPYPQDNYTIATGLDAASDSLTVEFPIGGYSDMDNPDYTKVADNDDQAKSNGIIDDDKNIINTDQYIKIGTKYYDKKNKGQKKQGFRIYEIELYGSKAPVWTNENKDKEHPYNFSEDDKAKLKDLSNGRIEVSVPDADNETTYIRVNGESRVPVVLKNGVGSVDIKNVLSAGKTSVDITSISVMRVGDKYPSVKVVKSEDVSDKGEYKAEGVIKTSDGEYKKLPTFNDNSGQKARPWDKTNDTLGMSLGIYWDKYNTTKWQNGKIDPESDYGITLDASNQTFDDCQATITISANEDTEISKAELYFDRTLKNMEVTANNESVDAAAAGAGTCTIIKNDKGETEEKAFKKFIVEPNNKQFEITFDGETRNDAVFIYECILYSDKVVATGTADKTPDPIDEEVQTFDFGKNADDSDVELTFNRIKIDWYGENIDEVFGAVDTDKIHLHYITKDDKGSGDNADAIPEGQHIKILKTDLDEASSSCTIILDTPVTATGLQINESPDISAIRVYNDTKISTDEITFSPVISTITGDKYEELFAAKDDSDNNKGGNEGNTDGEGDDEVDTVKIGLGLKGLYYLSGIRFDLTDDSKKITYKITTDDATDVTNSDRLLSVTQNVTIEINEDDLDNIEHIALIGSAYPVYHSDDSVTYNIASFARHEIVSNIDKINIVAANEYAKGNTTFIKIGDCDERLVAIGNNGIGKVILTDAEKAYINGNKGEVGGDPADFTITVSKLGKENPDIQLISFGEVVVESVDGTIEDTENALFDSKTDEDGGLGKAVNATLADGSGWFTVKLDKAYNLADLELVMGADTYADRRIFVSDKPITIENASSFDTNAVKGCEVTDKLNFITDEDGKTTISYVPEEDHKSVQYITVYLEADAGKNVDIYELFINAKTIIARSDDAWRNYYTLKSQLDTDEAFGKANAYGNNRYSSFYNADGNNAITEGLKAGDVDTIKIKYDGKTADYKHTNVRVRVNNGEAKQYVLSDDENGEIKEITVELTAEEQKEAITKVGVLRKLDKANATKRTSPKVELYKGNMLVATSETSEPEPDYAWVEYSGNDFKGDLTKDASKLVIIPDIGVEVHGVKVNGKDATSTENNDNKEVTISPAANVTKVELYLDKADDKNKVKIQVLDAADNVVASTDENDIVTANPWANAISYDTNKFTGSLENATKIVIVPNPNATITVDKVRVNGTTEESTTLDSKGYPTVELTTSITVTKVELLLTAGAQTDINSIQVYAGDELIASTLATDIGGWAVISDNFITGSKYEGAAKVEIEYPQTKPTTVKVKINGGIEQSVSLKDGKGTLDIASTVTVNKVEVYVEKEAEKPIVRLRDKDNHLIASTKTGETLYTPITGSDENKIDVTGTKDGDNVNLTVTATLKDALPDNGTAIVAVYDTNGKFVAVKLQPAAKDLKKVEVKDIKVPNATYDVFFMVWNKIDGKDSGMKPLLNEKLKATFNKK